MESSKKVNKLVALTTILVLALVVYPVLCTTEATAATVYVVDQNHQKASDQNPGTHQLPWKTIGKAASTLQAGDKVFVKSGIYRERVEVLNAGKAGAYITFAAHPGSTVIITGADPVTAQWIPVDGGPSVYYATGWTYTFAPEDQKRIDETRKQLVIPGVDKALLDEWLRTDLDEKQVFVDDDPPLAQVFDLNDMVPGTFFVDPTDGDKLYVRLKDDSNPASHLIEASIRTQVFIIHQKDYIRVRGFTMQRAANNVAGLHAVLLGGNFIRFERNSVLWMSGLGLSLDAYQGYRLFKNRMNYNGWMGAAGPFFKEAMFIGNETSHNGFRWKKIFDECLNKPECQSAIAFAHGGMKLGGVDSTTIIKHRAVGNIYHGIWIDGILQDGGNRILDSEFSDNGADGIRLEVAHSTEVAGNRIVVSETPVFQQKVTQYGIDITADDCLVHHNVIITSQKFSVGVLILDSPPEFSEGNKIYNNTIVNRASVLKAIGASTEKPTEIKNNIFAHFPEGISIFFATNPSVITQEYNDFWDIDPKKRVEWFNPSSQAFEPVPPGPGSLAVDPLFVDEAGGDFRLQPHSPAIDAGTFVGLPFCGSAPDMGAYERCK